MGLSTKVGTFLVASTDTVGTNIDVTCGFQPKAIVFFGVGRSDSTDAVGSASHRRSWGFGISDSQRYSLATASEVGAAAADADSGYTNARCYYVTNSDGAEEGGIDLAAIASWPADGFRVTVDDQMATDQRVSFLALGGSDITAVEVGNFALAIVTGNQDITLSGAFQPDVVLLMGLRTTTAPPLGISTASVYHFGAAVSSTQQAVIAGGTDEASTTMDTGSYGIEGPEILAQPAAANPTVLQERAAFVQMNSNGFRINVLEENNDASRSIYLAIKGIQARVGSVLTQTDITTDIVASGFGFQPGGILFFSVAKAEHTQDAPTVYDTYSMGAATGVSERVAQGLIDENGTANAEITTAIEYDEVYINLDTAAAVQGLMDLKSIDSGGFTCIMDDADPSQTMVMYVAFGPAAGPTRIPRPPAILNDLAIY